MLGRIHPKTIDVGLANPVAVRLDQGIDDVRADRVVVVGVVLQGGYVAALDLRIAVVVSNLAAAMIPVRVAQFGRHGTIGASPEAKRKLLVIGIVVWRIAWVSPIIARVIYHHVEDDTHRPRLPIFLKTVSSVDKVDEIFLGAEVGVDSQIVADVVPVIPTRIVLEHWR